jgi:hypothetical protein
MRLAATAAEPFATRQMMGFDSLRVLIPLLFVSFAFLGLVIRSTMVLSLKITAASPASPRRSAARCRWSPAQ